MLQLPKGAKPLLLEEKLSLIFRERRQVSEPMRNGDISNR
jgi:hypothetical protein